MNFNFKKFFHHNSIFSSEDFYKPFEKNAFGSGFKAFYKFRKFQKKHIHLFLDKFKTSQNLESGNKLYKEDFYKINSSYNKTLGNTDRTRNFVFNDNLKKDEKLRMFVNDNLSKESAADFGFNLPQTPGLFDKFSFLFRKYSPLFFFLDEAEVEQYHGLALKNITNQDKLDLFDYLTFSGWYNELKKFVDKRFISEKTFNKMRPLEFFYKTRLNSFDKPHPLFAEEFLKSNVFSNMSRKDYVEFSKYCSFLEHYINYRSKFSYFLTKQERLDVKNLLKKIGKEEIEKTFIRIKGKSRDVKDLNFQLMGLVDNYFGKHNLVKSFHKKSTVKKLNFVVEFDGKHHRLTSYSTRLINPDSFEEAPIITKEHLAEFFYQYNYLKDYKQFLTKKHYSKNSLVSENSIHGDLSENVYGKLEKMQSALNKEKDSKNLKNFFLNFENWFVKDNLKSDLNLKRLLVLNDLIKGKENSDSLNYNQLLSPRNIYLFINGGNQKQIIPINSNKYKLRNPSLNRFKITETDPLIQEAIVNYNSKVPYVKSKFFINFLHKKDLRDYKVVFNSSSPVLIFNFENLRINDFQKFVRSSFNSSFSRFFPNQHKYTDIFFNYNIDRDFNIFKSMDLKEFYGLTNKPKTKIRNKSSSYGGESISNVTKLVNSFYKVADFNNIHKNISKDEALNYTSKSFFKDAKLETIINNQSHILAIFNKNAESNKSTKIQSIEILSENNPFSKAIEDTYDDLYFTKHEKLVRVLLDNLKEVKEFNPEVFSEEQFKQGYQDYISLLRFDDITSKIMPSNILQLYNSNYKQKFYEDAVLRLYSNKIKKVRNRKIKAYARRLRLLRHFQLSEKLDNAFSQKLQTLINMDNSLRSPSLASLKNFNFSGQNTRRLRKLKSVLVQKMETNEQLSLKERKRIDSYFRTKFFAFLKQAENMQFSNKTESLESFTNIVDTLTDKLFFKLKADDKSYLVKIYTRVPGLKKYTSKQIKKKIKDYCIDVFLGKKEIEKNTDDALFLNSILEIATAINFRLKKENKIQKKFFKEFLISEFPFLKNLSDVEFQKLTDRIFDSKSKISQKFHVSAWNHIEELQDFNINNFYQNFFGLKKEESLLFDISPVDKKITKPFKKKKILQKKIQPVSVSLESKLAIFKKNLEELNSIKEINSKNLLLEKSLKSLIGLKQKLFDRLKNSHSGKLYRKTYKYPFAKNLFKAQLRKELDQHYKNLANLTRQSELEFKLIKMRRQATKPEYYAQREINLRSKLNLSKKIIKEKISENLKLNSHIRRKQLFLNKVKRFKNNVQIAESLKEKRNYKFYLELNRLLRDLQLLKNLKVLKPSLKSDKILKFFGNFKTTSLNERSKSTLFPKIGLRNSGIKLLRNSETIYWSNPFNGKSILLTPLVVKQNLNLRIPFESISQQRNFYYQKIFLGQNKFIFFKNLLLKKFRIGLSFKHFQSSILSRSMEPLWVSKKDIENILKPVFKFKRTAFSFSTSSFEESYFSISNWWKYKILKSSVDARMNVYSLMNWFKYKTLKFKVKLSDSEIFNAILTNVGVDRVNIMKDKIKSIFISKKINKSPFKRVKKFSFPRKKFSTKKFLTTVESKRLDQRRSFYFDKEGKIYINDINEFISPEVLFLNSRVFNKRFFNFFHSNLKTLGVDSFFKNYQPKSIKKGLKGGNNSIFNKSFEPLEQILEVELRLQKLLDRISNLKSLIGLKQKLFDRLKNSHSGKLYRKTYKYPFAKNLFKAQLRKELDQHYKNLANLTRQSELVEIEKVHVKNSVRISYFRIRKKRNSFKRRFLIKSYY